MEPGEILAALFPAGHAVARDGALLAGSGRLPDGGTVHVVGAGGGNPIGVDEAIRLSARVLDFAARDDGSPILVLIDTSSQRMSRRDELLGLNEYLAHLAKALLLAEALGHRTIALIHGGSAAGAFIAAALACDTLVALPGAHPEVMDLPSMARVTKLPLDELEEKALATPVFAPGLANIAKMGAVAETWDPARPLGEQLAALLARPRSAVDLRAARGAAAGGRPKAAAIAAEIVALAGAA